MMVTALVMMFVSGRLMIVAAVSLSWCPRNGVSFRSAMGIPSRRSALARGGACTAAAGVALATPRFGGGSAPSLWCPPPFRDNPRRILLPRLIGLPPGRMSLMSLSTILTMPSTWSRVTMSTRPCLLKALLAHRSAHLKVVPLLLCLLVPCLLVLRLRLVTLGAGLDGCLLSMAGSVLGPPVCTPRTLCASMGRTFGVKGVPPSPLGLWPGCSKWSAGAPLQMPRLVMCLAAWAAA